MMHESDWKDEYIGSRTVLSQIVSKSLENLHNAIAKTSNKEESQGDFVENTEIDESYYREKSTVGSSVNLLYKFINLTLVNLLCLYISDFDHLFHDLPFIILQCIRSKISMPYLAKLYDAQRICVFFTIYLICSIRKLSLVWISIKNVYKTPGMHDGNILLFILMYIFSGFLSLVMYRGIYFSIGLLMEKFEIPMLVCFGFSCLMIAAYLLFLYTELSVGMESSRYKEFKERFSWMHEIYLIYLWYGVLTMVVSLLLILLRLFQNKDPLGLVEFIPGIILYSLSSEDIFGRESE